jgi:hypothetical protein
MSSEYWLVAQAKDTLLFIDRESIKTKNGHFQAWGMYVHKSEKSFEKKKGYYKYSKSLDKYDCANELISVVVEAAYKADGEVIHSYDSSYDDWRHVIPDSLGGASFKFICHPNVMNWQPTTFKDDPNHSGGKVILIESSVEATKLGFDGAFDPLEFAIDYFKPEFKLIPAIKSIPRKKRRKN